MDIDITKFLIFNVIDTCSIENVLSSSTLYRATINAGCRFCYTKYVEYEMLYKPRKKVSIESQAIREKLIAETSSQIFECHNLSIDDLQDVEILEQRKKIGKGELSSIAYARKINQSFMTDDQRAKILGIEILGKTKTYTTPHLLGWLFYTRELIDSDFHQIIEEHEKCNRPLSEFFKLAYHESLRLKMLGV
ncbi:MAG: hypothetical protein LBU84_13370 [Prevotella sp.]|jgi:predicted nucleic acid-binding protein|nr:hypothetical protein [Prevotella sp.]